MKRTISAMVGQGSVNHNSRKFHAKNTDPERSHLNVTYCQENIKTVYHELFDEALERYNAKQTRADRRIEDYYEKIRSGKQEKPFHEIILQVGNRDDMSADSEEGQLAAAVLDEYMKGFQERNPQLRVFSAHLHMDEATPHLHIDFVPFTTGSKRGLDTRVSLKQALAAQGFKGGTRGDTEWSQWVRSEKERLSLVMERHGIEWEDKGTHDKHLSVLDYKKEQRAKEVAVLDTVKAEKESLVESQERRLKELAPAVKNMERLAADFSADPDEILPEPGTLETGRAYREKKAKPLLAQIVKVLRSLYLAYVELRGKFERLQGDYGRVRESNARLSDRLQEVKLENKALRQVSADYERVKRVFGPEQVEVAVQADKQREQAEKGRKRPRRSVDRGER
ncbi:plasmid recombination protein [Flavonifractor sp. An100]|uniref:plasmid recombination protein n=1 Tax=Flavonifractor sp. An100 TaxID=1965538 RepID=UPI0031B8B182